MPEGFRSGFVSILGRPSAGKSTLLNALVGAKVAIVSPRPQTTRTLVQGILTAEDAQIVFLDTPGIHEAGSLLNRRMMETIRTALESRDLLLYVADATSPVGEADRKAVELVAQARTPALLLLNKIDRIKDKSLLLPVIEQYRAIHDFAEYLPVSALRKDGVDEVRAAVVARLPEGPAYFPADALTDQPERFLAAELIREKILRETHEEVPHAVAVLVDKWEETEKLTRIAATIFVERPGQKAIVIGAGGAQLKKIGTLARQDIEALTGRKAFLELFVKLQPKWRDNPQFLNELDWRSMFGRERV